MKVLICLALPLLLSGTIQAQSQHADHQTPALSFAPVLSQALSDSELSAFKLESSVMTVSPGGIDTVSHRHDCDLFGYVLEGQIEIGLNKNPPTVYRAGQMFHEPRNVLHTLARNPDRARGARVLVIFIIKDGRTSYQPAYSSPTRK